MKFTFDEWPDGADVQEVWFTKISGEGVVTQVSLEFSKEDAENKARALNENVLPELATVLGPLRLVKGED